MFAAAPGTATKILPDSSADLAAMERSGSATGSQPEDNNSAPSKMMVPVTRNGAKFLVCCSADDDVYALKQELLPFTVGHWTDQPS